MLVVLSDASGGNDSSGANGACGAKWCSSGAKWC